MRKEQAGWLLAGVLVATIVATPCLAATDQVAPVAPPPAATGLNDDVAPVANVTPIDQQIADRLRALIDAKELDRRIDWVAARDAVEGFYAARNDAPIWIRDGKLSARGRAVIARLRDAAAEGLDHDAYPVPDFGSDPAALADADIGLTNAALDFARNLAVGRIAPQRVVSEVDYGDHTPAPADILKTLTQAADVNAALDGYDPPAPGFRALKAKLADLRREADSRQRNRAIDTIIANMERWRWLPHDLGRTYVMVNIPDYTLEVEHDGRVLWRTKIVDGKPSTPTPLLSAPMQQIIVNPSWHVPQSIIRHEFLPAYRGDPSIFARMGFEVHRDRDGHLSVVQPPGAGNALGRLKFDFANDFSVYLHDTPQKHLFSYAKRDFSHGCMRVEDPTRFGVLLLSLAMDGPTPDARQLRALFGHGARDFKLTHPPMVHLTYQTAFVDDAGKLALREDVYGIDARIHRAMLRNEQRRIAAAASLAPRLDPATLKSNREILRQVERREARTPFSYFERVFH